jgi:spore germination protein GerM
MTPARHRRAAAVLLSLLLAAAVAGCGLPTDDEPRELSADAVPFDLLAAPTTTLPGSPPADRSQIVNLYFRNDERLVPVPTLVAAPSDSTSSQPTPDAVITALLETESSELDRGVRSAIPPDTTLVDTRRAGDVLTIDLSEAFTTVESNLLIFAVAQLVYTSTELSGINRVRFAIEGERISVPDDEGVEQEGPVSPSDYLSLAPLPT